MAIIRLRISSRRRCSRRMRWAPNPISSKASERALNSSSILIETPPTPNNLLRIITQKRPSLLLSSSRNGSTYSPRTRKGKISSSRKSKQMQDWMQRRAKTTLLRIATTSSENRILKSKDSCKNGNHQRKSTSMRRAQPLTTPTINLSSESKPTSQLLFSTVKSTSSPAKPRSPKASWTSKKRGPINYGTC